MAYFRFVFAAVIAAALCACSSGASIAPPASSVQTQATTSTINADDARRVAGGQKRCDANLSVNPTSLSFTAPQSQTITVTVNHPTVVFAASDDPNAASVRPVYVTVSGKQGGTATFTVTPKKNGTSGKIGLIDLQCEYAVVPFTIGFAAPTPTPTPAPTPTSTTFGYTGAAQSFTVPSGVTHVTITALGAAGDAHFCGGTAGLGASVTATIPVVVPLETLAVYVGGWGSSPGDGFNGGGEEGSNVAGGGASDVREGGSAPANRVVVAGGGGSVGCDGAGGPAQGGNGGAPGGNGANGASTADGGGGGGGGTQTAGGAAGTSTSGFPGSAGGLGVGGVGGLFNSGNGGGGYYGGGGSGTGASTGNDQPSGNGGGGGGSSFVEATATGITGSAGGNPNEYGQVTITYIVAAH
jgi:hypothetical protein